MLIESLMSGIGVSISSSLLKLWLKDNALASDVTVDISKIIITKFSDIFTQKKVRRTFENIGDQAAKSISSLIKKEASGINEDRLKIIAAAASETLTNTPIDIDLLIDKNLQDENLLCYLLERTGAQGGNPALALNTKGLTNYTKVETELYRNLLSHSAQIIVDTASSFPKFDVKINGALLNKLEHIAEELMDGMNLIVEERSDRYEGDYRNACVRKHDQLELFGVDLNEANQRYNLSVAYVTLMVESKQNNSSSIMLSVESETGCEDIGNDADLDVRTSIQAHQALLENQRLFIRAPAGAGKTTLLQWFTVFCAARKLEGDLKQFNGFVPFFIKLRDCVDGKSTKDGSFNLPDISDFASCSVSTIGKSAPDNWIYDRLKSGKAFVLIDGLDEVTENKREDVKKWLGELVETFPEVRYVVTSRPHAAEEGWLDADSFTDAELQEMETKDVYEFVEHWHDAVSDGINAPEEKEEVKELSNALIEKLSKNPSIHRLATSPLLCALLCALHRQRVQNLPNDRLELYRVCVEMFLRRDEERRIDGSDYIKITDRQKFELLQKMAWWMISNGRTTITPEEAAERFHDYYDLLHRVDSIVNAGKKVTDLFLQRIGIIRMLAHSKIDFPHRTFQEYLAAREAVDGDHTGLLVNNAHDDQWREVFILAAGLLPPLRAEQMLAELLEKSDLDVKNRETLILTAIACLAVVNSQASKDSTVYREIKKRLNSILPPSSMTEAKTLAAAGDLVVPYLERPSSMNVIKAKASVRVLALVGTDLALETLKAYANDKRIGVLDELEMSAKFASNFEAYSEIVWANKSKINLSFEQCCDISFLSKNNNISKLLLQYSGIQNIEALSHTTNIEFLDISNTIVENIEPIINNSGLKFLNMSETNVVKLDPLSNMTNLAHLNITYTSIKSLAVLKRLRNLIHLNISYSEVDDLEALENHENLEYLNISHTDVSSLSGIVNNKRLVHLDISSTQITDLDLISEFPLLKELLVCDQFENQKQLIKDFTPIMKLRNLQYIHIPDNWEIDNEVIEWFIETGVRYNRSWLENLIVENLNEN
ncbi:MAG: NACHT N-terminal Helical domain 1-containing protein [Akkermansiaceae bacterium]